MNEQYRFIDTVAMPWEDHVRPGANERRKVLHVDACTQGYVHLRYVPAGVSTKTTRIFHATVRELGFWLSGELLGWNYKSPEDESPVVQTNRRGSFMDRPPRSLHGARPGTRSVAGTEFLIWCTHGGEFEIDAAETFSVSPGDAPPAGGFTMPRIVQTDEIPWCVHSAVASWKIKQLAQAEADGQAGIVPVCLVSIPRNWHAHGATLPARGSWLYVTDGSLIIQGSSDDMIPMRKGGYLRWCAPAHLRIASAGDEGATLLCVGHDLSG